MALKDRQQPASTIDDKINKRLQDRQQKQQQKQQARKGAQVRVAAATALLATPNCKYCLCVRVLVTFPGSSWLDVCAAAAACKCFYCTFVKPSPAGRH